MEPPKEKLSEANQALTSLKEEYLKRYNCWPGSHFTAAVKTELLTKSRDVKVRKTGDHSYDWVLGSAQTLPRVLAAMFNSKATGDVQLPKGTEYDEVAGLLRENMLPVPSLTADGLVAGGAILWKAETCTVNVHASPEQLYFSGVSVRKRNGATGSELTIKELQVQILSVQVKHVCSPQLAEVCIAVREDPESMMSLAKDEDDIRENKQRAWWQSEAADQWYNDNDNIIVCACNHFKKYLLEMYALDVKGHIRPSTLTLGVEDTSCKKVGVPVSGSLDTLKIELHRAVAEVFSRLFPSPPATCEVVIVRLDTAELEKSTFQAMNGQVVVITKPVHFSQAYKTGWVLAVTADVAGSPLQGVIFSAAGEVVHDETAGTLTIAGKMLRSQDGDFQLCNVDELTVLTHVVVDIVTRAKDSPTPPSRALFSAGSFQLSAMFKGNFMQLSPFCAWAWVRHRAYPMGVWGFIGRPRTTAAVVKYDESAGNLEGSPLADLTTRSKIEISREGELVVTYCLGADDSDLLRTEGSCAVALLDIDPRRLQRATRYAVERSDFDVADVRLLTSWADLYGERSRALPPAFSEPGIESIKSFLLGECCLPQQEDYLSCGSAPRSTEIFLIGELRPFLTCTGLTIRKVHVVLRGSGTTTLLQRVALTLSNDVVQACVADEAREGVTTAVAAIQKCQSTVRCQSFMLLFVTSNWDESCKVAKELQNLQKNRPELAVVLLVALVHDVGDMTVPWTDPTETILNPALTTDEVNDFVSLYSRFFPDAKDALAELKGRTMIAGLPALTVSGGHHVPSQMALEQLVNSVQGNADDIRYLAQLAVVELFAADPGNAEVNLVVSGPAFTEDWIWLLTEPTTRAHRLCSVIWAIPLLQLTAHIAVSVDPDRPSGFDVNDAKSAGGFRPTPLGDLLLEAMLRLVRSGLNLNAFLRKAPYGQPGNRMPRWIQVVGDEAASKVLFDLTRKFPFTGDALKSRPPELLKSWTQACILRMQLLMPHAPTDSVEHWLGAVEEADYMCEEVHDSMCDLLARANRAWLLGLAVAATDPDTKSTVFRKKWSNTCYSDFSTVLNSKPDVVLLDGVFRALEPAFDRRSAKMTTNRNSHSTSTVQGLYTQLKALVGDGERAKSPDVDVTIISFNYGGGGGGGKKTAGPFSALPDLVSLTQPRALRPTVRDLNVLLGAQTDSGES